MRILVSGDIHNHIFGNFAVNKNTINNSRYAAIRDVLEQMFTYATTQGIDCIVLNGDIFETKNVIESYVNNTFYDWCKKVTDRNIILILNVGNHDISSIHDETITLLHTYESLPNLYVIDKPTILPHSIFEGYCNMVIMPFRRKVTETIKSITDCIHNIKKDTTTYGEDKVNLLFYHGAVVGARMTGRECTDEKNALKTAHLQPDFFSYVFLSHFHTHQKLGSNIMYVGAPLHHDMSDAGQDRGFVDLDCKHMKLAYIPTSFPRFNIITLNEYADLEKVNCLTDKDYYEIRVNTPDITKKDLQFASPTVHVVWNTQKPSVVRIDDVNVHTDINEIIGKYVDVKLKDDEKKCYDLNKLKEMGMRYASNAKSN